MLHKFDIVDIRAYCWTMLETFETWARRLIHQEFNTYGPDYFDITITNNERILNNKHYGSYLKVKKDEPSRVNRPVDALFLETLIYILCKEPYYHKHFKKALDYAYPQGRDEVSEMLKRLIAPRNQLAHSNAISIRQAERIICYVGDFIDGLKEYYKEIGESKLWNTPMIIKVTDSLGNTYYPEESKTANQSFTIDHIFHVGDMYKVWAEVDLSFELADYSITWEYFDNKKIAYDKFNSLAFERTFREYDIGKMSILNCKIISNKVWHKHGSHDQQLSFQISVAPNK